MLKLLERTYLSVFRRYPMLLRMALVVFVLPPCSCWLKG
jgi:ABC-type amino acid transport system permease subunit